MHHLQMSYLFTLSPRFVPSEDANGSNFEHLVPVAAALAVAISVLLMQITKTVHPPGERESVSLYLSRP